ALATLTLNGSTFPSTSGSGLKMPGKSTWTSFSSCGATTMKMMSSTRTTSTSGVTFMSGRGSPARTRLRHETLPCPMLLRLVLGPAVDRVEKPARRRVERHLVARDRRREVVECEHGRNRHREAERGLDERLADAGRHRGETARPGGRDALECGDDAEHRAE